MFGIRLGNGDMIKKLFSYRGLVIGVIIMGAFAAFQAFNYFTTYTALHDMFGPMAVFGMKLATTLTIALCFMDLAGLARVFTPQTGADEPDEVWYLLGAWFLACLCDAVLTWWAITVAMQINPSGSVMFASNPATRQYAPVLIAVIELLTRLGLVTFIAKAGDRMFSYNKGAARPSYQTQRPTAYNQPVTQTSYPRPGTQSTLGRTAAPKPQASVRPIYNEPTYHPRGMNDPKDIP